MILVTGPTGSGKSTTLYSALKEIMSPEDNIITVEDPVEYQLEGINQVPVNVKRGLTFAAALRSILRQDPDKIMIGEIRDKETVEIAVKAALTGHLVLSHPPHQRRALDHHAHGGHGRGPVHGRLLGAARLGPEARAGACARNASEKIELPPERLICARLHRRRRLPPSPLLYKAKGCPRCAGGYKGRFALLETLPVTEEVQQIDHQGQERRRT